MATTVTDRAQGIILAEALKSPVRVATTANITLSGLQTIDGVVLSANDRVLVKSQTDAVENGIYVAASSAWTRSSDFNGIYDVVQGTRVYIAAGTLYAGYEATITTENPITIGTSEITFALLLVVDAGLSADIETVADNIADINTCADNIAAIIAAPAEAADAAASADDAEYWAGIAAGGGITSITAGTGIIVDDTDPTAPEVSVDVGTTANKIVQLTAAAKLPAVDGSLLTNLPIPSSSVVLRTQVKTANGTYTPDAHLLYAVVQLVGGGGGGGGCPAASSYFMAGSGGGAGGYSTELLTAATIGASQSVTIGNSGTAGSNSGGDGGNGGTTSFGSLLSATGGSGGLGSIINVASCLQGGAGGAGSGGNINASGAGGGGNFSSNATTNTFSGFGGASFFGGGGIGYFKGTTNAANGAAGASYGSGGGGGIAAANVGQTGGAGGAGVILIHEYCSE